MSGISTLFYGDGNKWRIIWKANKAVLPDPNTLRPGLALTIPAIDPAPAAAVSRRPPPERDKTHGADSLHYYEGGAPWARVEDMTLFFSERRITIDCYRSGDDYRKKQNATLRRDHVCTEAEWRDIVGWLGAARFNEWDEVYAPGAFDGTVWRLEFLSGTNIVCRFMGHNNWPKRFYEFRKVKDFAMKLPEEPHAEGAKIESHAEAAEFESHAELAKSAEMTSHAENAESAEPQSNVPAECFWYAGEPDYQWHPLSSADSARVLERLAALDDWPPAPGYRPDVGVCEVRRILRVVRATGATNDYSFSMYGNADGCFKNCQSDPAGTVRLVPEPVRRELVRLREAWDREIEAARTDRILDASSTVRYERFSEEDGDGETHAVSKTDGDEILALLLDWRLFEDCRPKPAPGEPIICVLPAPPTLVLTCYRADGSSVEIEFFRYEDCKTRKPVLEVRPPSFSWQRRIPADSARALLAKFDAWSAADRAAFLAVPLPRTYVFGTTAWDGGTLSGCAKLFYGNGSKWRVIWKANKAAVPNPNYVLSGTPLLIPALPSP